MAASPPSEPELRQRLGALGARLGAREAEHHEALRAARECAARLRETVADGLEAFHAEAARSGADHLQIELGPLQLDDKHARAIQFDLRRGRHAGIVTVKSRGEITLVGPFRTGKSEGPCRSFPFGAREELSEALADFLERFLEEAASP